jgi:hypothetical protein
MGFCCLNPKFSETALKTHRLAYQSKLRIKNNEIFLKNLI